MLQPKAAVEFDQAINYVNKIKASSLHPSKHCMSLHLRSTCGQQVALGLFPALVPVLPCKHTTASCW